MRAVDREASYLGQMDIASCGKLKICDQLLTSWLQNYSNKILIFSNSTRLLDVLETRLMTSRFVTIPSVAFVPSKTAVVNLH